MSADGLAEGHEPRPTANMASLCERPANERIQLIRSGSFIAYPRARKVLNELAYTLRQPPSSRMIGVTLSGPTNNGKTTLIRTFVAKARDSVANTTLNAERVEFLHVDAPPIPSPSMLFTEILRKAGDLKAERGSMNLKLHRTLHILPQIGLKMLFLDEIHNVLAGSAKMCEAFLNSLKYLSNQLQIPVVLIGTENAVNVIRTDAQVLSRFPPIMLPPWGMGDDYSELVRRVLATLPLREAPQLSARSIKRIHALTNGAIGGLVQLLQRSAVRAIESGTERLDDTLIDLVAV